MEQTESTIINQGVSSESIERLLSASLDEVRSALQNNDPRTRAMALLIMELHEPQDEQTIAARAKAAPSLRYRVTP